MIFILLVLFMACGFAVYANKNLSKGVKASYVAILFVIWMFFVCLIK